MNQAQTLLEIENFMLKGYLEEHTTGMISSLDF